MAAVETLAAVVYKVGRGGLGGVLDQPTVIVGEPSLLANMAWMPRSM
jgi:hypothetical protein